MAGRLVNNELKMVQKEVTVPLCSSGICLQGLWRTTKKTRYQKETWTRDFPHTKLDCYWSRRSMLFLLVKTTHICYMTYWCNYETCVVSFVQAYNTCTMFFPDLHIYISESSLGPSNIGRMLATCFKLLSCLASTSNLNTEAKCSSETSDDFQRTTWCYIPENGPLQPGFSVRNVFSLCRKHSSPTSTSGWNTAHSAASFYLY
jgi:hypothetical protein